MSGVAHDVLPVAWFGQLVYAIRTSAQWEIIPWVQSFGAMAELVAPLSWRSAVRANAEAMLARYGT
jgi:predicted DNA-binding transcriptional regulator YafY